MAQTAVEWLESEFLIANGKLTFKEFERAKEMEKQQIMFAFYDGKSNGMDISHNLSSTKEITSEQYYNETFKSE